MPSGAVGDEGVELGGGFGMQALQRVHLRLQRVQHGIGIHFKYGVQSKSMYLSVSAIHQSIHCMFWYVWPLDSTYPLLGWRLSRLTINPVTFGIPGVAILHSFSSVRPWYCNRAPSV